jgi:2-dehydropantoate 2-reductase
MEVEAILGNGLRVAKRHGVSAPHMESLYGLLKLVDKKIREQKSQNRPPSVNP